MEKRMKFEIWTEDLNREYMEHLFDKHYDGYTVNEQIGFWKGHKEASLMITIITIAADKDLIVTLIEKIKQYNEQECIMLTMTPVKMELI